MKAIFYQQGKILLSRKKKKKIDIIFNINIFFLFHSLNSTPPSTLTIEELDVDEHFDISILSLIQNDIVLYLGQPRVPKDIIERLVHIIHECSRLYYVDENEPSHRDDTKDNKTEKPVSKNSIFHGRTSDLVSTTGTIVPVMKESFAYSALKLLFTLCSSEKQGTISIQIYTN